MTVREEVEDILKRAKKPLKTTEVVDRLYPTAPPYKKAENRSAVFSKLKMLERYGWVKRTKSKDGKKNVVYWEWIR